MSGLCKTCVRCGELFWPLDPEKATCGRCFDHPDHQAFREMFELGAAFGPLSDADFLRSIKVKLPEDVPDDRGADDQPA